MTSFSISKLAFVAAATVVSVNALAQTPAPAKAPEPEYTVTGNLGIFSDYRFRGISQTNKLPAIQGGVDLALKNGLYLGNWNSNVDSTMYNGASIEMDFYGGYKATFGDFGLDVGGIYYYYPGTGANPAGWEYQERRNLYRRHLGSGDGQVQLRRRPTSSALRTPTAAGTSTSPPRMTSAMASVSMARSATRA